MNKPTITTTNKYSEIVMDRFASLPPVTEPRKDNTAVFIPLYDGRVEWATVEGLMQSSGYYSGISSLPCCSDVTYARNRLLNQFLLMPFEWAVLVDSDIGFTVNDFCYLMDGNEYAVNAVYSKKDATNTVVREGLGFARVHRCVLEALIKIPELCIPFRRHNERLYGFCFAGPVGIEDRYLGEDQAFWFMLSQIGVIPRIETRVNLRHIGRYDYKITNASVLIGSGSADEFSLAARAGPGSADEFTALEMSEDRDREYDEDYKPD